MNRLLSYLVGLAIFLFVFLLVVECGLRLFGLGPQPSINEFHPYLGWVKKKNTTSTRRTSEFDVTYTINSIGLRDDENMTLEKAADTKRILFLGDSFTLGYTVNRKDLFLDLLENKYREEGRKVEIINCGTEGYSTDQELLWLREIGLKELKLDPDIVVMNFYQNDVFWNSRKQYLRFPKPLFPAIGGAEATVQKELENPGAQSWFTRTFAVGKILSRFGLSMPLHETAKGRFIPAEWSVLLNDEPETIKKAWLHTKAILKGFKHTCEDRGIKPVVALIPSKAQIYSGFKADQREQLGVKDNEWNPDLPFKTMLALCDETGLDTVDPMLLFMREARDGTDLYYTKDRHFSPEGNRAFAQALYNHLNRNIYLGESKVASTPIAAGSGVAEELPDPEKGVPLWVWVVLALWITLGLMYAISYRDENGFLGFIKVGALIASVVGIVAFFNLLAAILPAGAGSLVVGVVLIGVIVFLLWKLRKRIGIVIELYLAFTHRGHWYMMPLLAVMLAIGSLLIVAASSPFVAPFIYTLF